MTFQSRCSNTFCSQEYAKAIRGPLALCLILLFLLIFEFATAWPHGHYEVSRELTKALPLELWQTLTTFGDARALLAILLPLSLRYRKIVWPFLLSLLIGWLVVRGMKHWFQVPRPGLLLSAIDPGLPTSEARRYNSFPSSHAMVIFSFVATGLALLPRRWALPLLALAAMVGCSRVGIGAHWPVDVLAGGLVGTVAACLGIFLGQISDWPEQPRFQAILMVIVLIAVLTLPFLDTRYSHTLWLRILLAALALGSVAYRFVRVNPDISSLEGRRSH
jgi:membrane-associated phospholipid phosphatase